MLSYNLSIGKRIDDDEFRTSYALLVNETQKYREQLET